MTALTSTGLEIRTQGQIQADLETAERAEVSADLDLSTSSPLGQINRIFARALRLGEEGLAALYAAIDPDSASGDALLRLSALTGTYREAASKTRVSADVDLDAGVYAIGTLVVAPDGRPEDRLSNIEEITTAGAVETVLFDAEIAGALDVTANTLVIASPLAGFNSVDSSLGGVTGSPIETEAALRLRRRSEVESPGSSSAAGIVADLTREIAAIISASVTENDTDGVVDSVPAHAIEAIVYGPLSPTADENEEVALQILASKAAGIGTYGNTSITVVDPEGQSKLVRFTRPTLVPATITLSILVNSTTYAGDTALAEHLADRALEEWIPGLDVSWSQVLGWAHEVQGVLRATTINVGGGAFVNVAISTRQIATLESTDITVTSAGATP